jgi:hypothetical protein
MTLPAVIGFSLPLFCPLHAFAFPSVSPFCRGYNLEGLNNLRSDYPLNSPSAEWCYFGPPELGQSVGAPLPLRSMLLLGLRAEASRAAANESCPDYAIPVCVVALPSRPRSQDNNTFRDDLFNSRTSVSGTEPRRPSRAQPPPLKCLPKWQAIRQEPSDLVQGLTTISAEPT